jgi:hypothetical protein
LDISASLSEKLADIQSQIATVEVLAATVGWRPPIKNLSLSATGSLQGVFFSDYPGGRQDLVFVGSGSVNWAPNAKLSLGGGVRFTQQLSTQSDLDWNGFNAVPQVQVNYKIH